MFTLLSSSVFEGWLSKLTDQTAKARVLTRLRSASLGNFGDCESVGGGYRVYYTRTGRSIYFLLCGGDKSTQKKDILKAKEMAATLTTEDKP